MTFGKFLMQRGVLTRVQIDEAAQSQVVFGGRLGTNLVELAYLRLEDLERHLSEHHGIPVAPLGRIERPSEAALNAVPKELVERYGILPLALEKRTLHLAMLDPRNARQVDEIAFATGLRVQPYVMSELRLTALLEHHYDIRRDIRYIHLGPEAARGRHAPAAPDPSGDRKGGQPGSGGRPAGEELGMTPLDADQELIDEATFSSLHERWQAPEAAAEEPAAAEPPSDTPPPSAPPEPASHAGPANGPPGTARGGAAATGAAVHSAALEAQLAEANDRDSVGRLGLAIARFHASAAALFVVRGGMVSGFLAYGEGTERNVDGILIPVEIESIFSRPATARTPYRGRPPEAGIDARVLGAMARRGVREALVLPISVRDRVINLLYADNGSEPFGETSVAALTALCGCIARAYERLILERKGRFA